MSEAAGQDFIRQIIHDDLASGKHGEIVTRFPPEPNGYLHVGHVMAICLNFSVTQETGGRTYLRFDDTNPGKESEEYVRAIQHDVHWLGYDWGDRLTHASDYFQQLHAAAVQLIEAGVAYVDSLSADEIREHRRSQVYEGVDRRGCMLNAPFGMESATKLLQEILFITAVLVLTSILFSGLL